MKPRTAGYALRLPLSLKEEAERLAAGEKSSLNQFIVNAVAEKVSSMSGEGDRSVADETARPGAENDEVGSESV